MKKYIGILSLVAATLLITGCDDTTVNTTELNSYTVTGDVKGCITDEEALPLQGVTVTLGNVSGTTGTDGCYALNISLTTMNSQDAVATVFNAQDVVATHEMYEDTTMTFTPTENVVAGVIWDFGTYHLDTDGVSPEDEGILDTPYANNMLIEGINASTSSPITIQLSEYVNLADDINDDILVEIYDENQTAVSSTVTAQASFDSKTNILSISTSEAITAGYSLTIRIPAESIIDVNKNEIIAGVDASVNPYGASLTDYWNFTVRIFAEGDLNAQAVSSFSQMAKDSGLDTGEVYSGDLSDLEALNSAFNNAVKYDENHMNALQISNFNNTSANANTVRDLANAYITDPTTSGTTIVENILRIKFTPTNADYYVIKAYDENNNSVAFTGVIEGINAANMSISAGKLTVSTDESASDDIELALSGLDGSVSTTVAVVPYSVAGTAGTATIITVADNTAPTTSLQYSYGGSDDTSSVVSGGVVTSVLYGGSGETSNPEDNVTDIVLNIGTPYLEMTNSLLIDQNATLQNTGLNTLATPYTAIDYATWVSKAERSIGIGFTEPININGRATLTDAGGTASTLITSTVNTTNNLPVTSAFTALTEDIAIVTVSNIFTLVNEHNGSVIDLTSITTDLAGNSASNAKVVLLDKVAPFVTRADINSSDLANSTITFSESMQAGIINIDGTNCTINDIDITANVVNLNGCAIVGSGIQNINFSNIQDANGNANITHTFDANVTN